MAISVVWLKRDLRLTDHDPLVKAIESGLPVLLVYNFEPMLLNDAHYSPRHWNFIAQSLLDIKARVPQGALLCAQQDMLSLLTELHQQYEVKLLFSHQEIGLKNTFDRDLAVSAWCKERGVNWLESATGAVVRGKTNRQGWDRNWDKHMRAEIQPIDLEKVHWQQVIEQEQDSSALINSFILTEPFQCGGENAASHTVQSFFSQRGQKYAFNLSSPSASQHFCSRLSPYLAWGNLSVRQVYQQVLSHWHRPGWRQSMMAFSSRLHWHCHFIQKFESECEMEFRAVNRGYEDLPRKTDAQAQQWLKAWQQGMTGIPMVDACMRCLLATGYLNFRMRAMLVSFLCHHLQLDWRLGVKHLAQVFLDFEPGIHYSQFQMQAGITGINTIRIYNPIKQGLDRDADGVFVRQWLPEFASVPDTLIHTPWLLTEMEQVMFGIKIGEDYPQPIVDVEQSYKQAQELLWSWKNKPKVVMEKQRILQRHVRPASAC